MLCAAGDPRQLEFTTSQSRVLVTLDAEFLRLHHDGVPHRGIVYCRQNSRSIGDIVRALLLIYEHVSADEMTQQVEFI